MNSLRVCFKVLDLLNILFSNLRSLPPKTKDFRSSIQGCLRLFLDSTVQFKWIHVLNCSFYPLTTPSRPSNNCSTTPMLHFPLFFSSPFTSTTSPTCGCLIFPLCVKLCLSRKPLRNSLVYLFHTLSLQCFIYFARFLSFFSSVESSSPSSFSIRGKV